MVTVYCPVPPEAVERIATTVVEERLAACVNAVDCRSVYRWDATIHDEVETILLCKTTDDAADALADRLVDLHPYEVPCVERFEADQVLDAFAEWRADAVD